MKLMELTKIAGTCKNCGLMKKRKKSDFPKHPVLIMIIIIHLFYIALFNDPKLLTEVKTQ